MCETDSRIHTHIHHRLVADAAVFADEDADAAAHLDAISHNVRKLTIARLLSKESADGMASGYVMDQHFRRVAHRINFALGIVLMEHAFPVNDGGLGTVYSCVEAGDGVLDDQAEQVIVDDALAISNW